MIRINLHRDAKSFGYPVPKWFETMMSEMVNATCIDLQVAPNQIHAYLFPITDDADRLAELLKTSIGLDAKSYKIDKVPSWGLLLREDDPLVVEYKLKFGEGSSLI